MGLRQMRGEREGEVGPNGVSTKNSVRKEEI